jgi:hypothetical protein
MYVTPELEAELEAELNATPVETAVDKVLDGIDAAKVREALITELDEMDVVDCSRLDEIADKLLEKFIITPRS